MSNVVRLDNMAGTHSPSALFSGKYATVSGGNYTPAAIDNGMPGKLCGLIEGERELHWVTPAAKADKIENVCLIASVEYSADVTKKALEDFTNEANSEIRVYKLHSGDEFSVTVGCFANGENDKPVVGDIVELADGKWNAVTTLTSGSTKIGYIMAVETFGKRTYYVVHVD